MSMKNKRTNNDTIRYGMPLLGFGGLVQYPPTAVQYSAFIKSLLKCIAHNKLSTISNALHGPHSESNGFYTSYHLHTKSQY